MTGSWIRADWGLAEARDQPPRIRRVLLPHMIALAWSRRLEPGRALVVRHAVLDTGVPVVLVPMPAS